MSKNYNLSVNNPIIINEEILTEENKKVMAKRKELLVNFLRDKLNMPNAAEFFDKEVEPTYINSWLPNNFKFQELRKDNNLLKFLNQRYHKLKESGVFNTPDMRVDINNIRQDSDHKINSLPIFRDIYSIYVDNNGFDDKYFSRENIILDDPELYKKYSTDQIKIIADYDINNIDNSNFDIFKQRVDSKQVEELFKNNKSYQEKKEKSRKISTSRQLSNAIENLNDNEIEGVIAALSKTEKGSKFLKSIVSKAK